MGTKIYFGIPVFFFALICQICISNAGNILIIPSMVSPSHKMGMVPLADTLAERGHYVLFWAPVASEDPYIPKKAAWRQPKGRVDDQWLNDMFVHKNESTLFTIPWELSISLPGLESIFAYQVTPFCEDLLTNQKQEFTDILSKKWDLIIIDELFNPCGFLLTHLTGAPVIVYVSTSCLTRHSTFRNSQPAPRSYVPYCANLDAFTDRLSFLQRAHNFALTFSAHVMDVTAFAIISRRLRAFYPEVADVTAGVTKPDLTFFYFHKEVDFAAPLMPNMVHVGGLHVRDDHKEIPEGVLKAIERGKIGFILVSTGHWARFEDARPEVRRAFIDAFRRVGDDGLSVIWQYKGEVAEEIPDHVYRFDWLPQRELLAHPKCKAFLTHCGCNSALEAIMNGVPMVALGLFADQVSGAALVESKGISIRLDKKKLTADIIYKSIIQVATNSSMHAKAKLFASIVAHKPMTAMDTAVFWSEHVIRHKGGKWMRTRLPPNMTSTIKYYCIDVIGMMLAVLAILLYVIIKIVKFCWRLVVGEKGLK